MASRIIQPPSINEEIKGAIGSINIYQDHLSIPGWPIQAPEAVAMLFVEDGVFGCQIICSVYIIRQVIGFYSGVQSTVHVSPKEPEYLGVYGDLGLSVIKGSLVLKQ